ncbi:tryptophan synthase subunit alpha [Actinoplanes sp. M2I2]|uniref:tryptophan synthase subunit alpha n=1 Tax=Actinoplanes sp. M2I2 TaxID=1734444 RepID=UPI0024C3C9FB|nr:tryptophan synthase subunit alpha [Actinoplanes sp. M2I2]
MTAKQAAGRSLLGPAHPAANRPLPADKPVIHRSGLEADQADQADEAPGVQKLATRRAGGAAGGDPGPGGAGGNAEPEPGTGGSDGDAVAEPGPGGDAGAKPGPGGAGGTGPLAGGGGGADPLAGRAAAGAGRPGRKLLVPYLTAGVTDNWIDYLLAMQEAGADAVEIGLPFSDPMLDGTTVQQSADRALARGVTMTSILRELHEARGRLRVPLIAFTYANLVFRPGPAVFCRRLAEAGVHGLIVPDLPLDEAGEVERAAAEAGVDLTLLVAPVTSDERLAEIVRRSRGYIYAISRMGTTGERDSLAASAATLATRIKAAQAAATSAPASPRTGTSTSAGAAISIATGTTSSTDAATATDMGTSTSLGARAFPPPLAGATPSHGPVGRLPVLIGFGVSGPGQAAEAGRAGDGVVVGSALMRRVLDGATPRDLTEDVAALRAALDALDQEASADRAAYAEVSGDRR